MEDKSLYEQIIGGDSLAKMVYKMNQAIKGLCKFCDELQGLSLEISSMRLDVNGLVDKFYRQSMIGNIQNYIDWAREYPNIGNVRVQPLRLGANTVRVLITDDANNPASKILVDCFQFYLDPNSAGLGNGVAPIGAHVTVAPGTVRFIDIQAQIRLAYGYIKAEGALQAIERYTNSIASIKGCINYNEILDVLSNVASIESVSNLLIGGGGSSIDLNDDDIPVINGVTLEVV